MPSAERTRVLFLAHAYPRHAGDPVGSFIANLAGVLRAQGVDVVVSAPSAPGLPAYELTDGIAVHRFRYAPQGRETLAYTGTMGAQVKDGLGGKLAMLSYLAAAALAARRLVRDERIHLLHAHWWFPGGLVAAAVARASGIPMITTLHGSDLRLASAFPMGGRLLAAVLRASSAVTAVSGWLARGAEESVPGLGALVAPMPVLDALFDRSGDSSPRDADRLLFVGKLSEQKGLGRLLDAMARMRTRPRLTVVGAGRVDDAPLRAHAAALGLEQRIEWLPLLTQRELAAQYRRAAVHVVPALDEGLGLTAVESLLSETPVVGFASGGLPDIVRDGESGRLVPAGDVGALAGALDALLGDEAVRQAMGRAGRTDAARRFGAGAAAARYAELYRRVLRERATR
jgi:glycosyltransferase involved in cell wall biosynthesis